MYNCLHIARMVTILTGTSGGSLHSGKNGFTTYVPKDMAITVNMVGRARNSPTCRINSV